METVVLRLDCVGRMYQVGTERVTALAAVSLEVKAGELVAVWGPSGSGKSTLLALAGGLDLPTTGSVLVEGNDLTSLASVARARLRRDRVGFVFQDLNLVGTLTAQENVALPRELAGVGRRVAHREALDALAEVDLRAEADRFPDQLSGGQQQRVAIARALIGERRLLLADEPTGALDTATGQAVLDIVRVRVDAGAAGVVVTHERDVADRADRMIVLRDGHLVPSGTAPTGGSAAGSIA